MAILNIGSHLWPKPEQQGARDFLFWHFAQIQYKNPHLQLIKQLDISVTPFAQAFLGMLSIFITLEYLDSVDGREVMFDLENKNKDEIVDLIQGTLGKTKLVRRREFLESMRDQNPADFGSDCARQCMCTVQGQVPCTGLIHAPEYMKGQWRWNHNLI